MFLGKFGLHENHLNEHSFVGGSIERVPNSASVKLKHLASVDFSVLAQTPQTPLMLGTSTLPAKFVIE